MATSSHFSKLIFIFCLLFSISNLNAQWYQIGDTMYSINSTEQTGSAVAISDDAQTVIVGGEYGNINATNSGVARIFEWNGSSLWAQKGLDLLGENVDERFGHSLCISDNGDIVAIGASNIAGSAGGPGYVKVFSWNGSAWIQMGSTLTGTANGNRFGFSVSMNDDGTILAAGAIGSSKV